jgi:hypothetical protein
MYELIAALVSAISSVSNAKLDTVRRQIIAEGETSRAYIEGAEALNVSVWRGLEGQSAINNILSASLAKKIIAEKEAARLKQRKHENKKQQWVLIALMGGVSLVVLFILLKD